MIENRSSASPFAPNVLTTDNWANCWPSANALGTGAALACAAAKVNAINKARFVAHLPYSPYIIAQPKTEVTN